MTSKIQVVDTFAQGPKDRTPLQRKIPRIALLVIR